MVKVISTINVMPDYHLRSRTILYPAPNPLDRCNVFMGNIDVTDRLIQFISGPLNDLGKQVDAKIAQTEEVPERLLLSAVHAGGERFGIVGDLDARRRVIRKQGFPSKQGLTVGHGNAFRCLLNQLARSKIDVNLDAIDQHERGDRLAQS